MWGVAAKIALALAIVSAWLLAVPATGVAAWPVEFEPMQYVPGPDGNDRWPNSAVIGDLTGDGRNDVAIENLDLFGNGDRGVSVFEQGVDGSLVRHEYSLNKTAVAESGLAIADLDGDGEADDLAVGVEGGIALFHHRLGTALDGPDFIPTPVALPEDIAVADIFRDGRPDFVIASSDLGVVLMRSGPSGYVPVHLGGLWASDVDVGYLNGDGLPDIVSSGYGAGYGTWVSYQRPDGNFTMSPLPPSTLATNTAISGIEVADVTGDGRQDLIGTIGCNPPNSRIVVFKQRPDGSLAGPDEYPTYDLASAVRAADMDGDGDDDLVVAHDEGLKFSLYLNQGGGHFGDENSINGEFDAFGPNGMAVGDISCDGRADVVFRSVKAGLYIHRQRRPESSVPGCPAAPRSPAPTVPPPEYGAGAPAPPTGPLLPGNPDGDVSPSSGDIFVLQDFGEIVQIDPESGRQRLVTNRVISRRAGGGDYLESPRDLEVGPDGTIYVAEQAGIPSGYGQGVVGVDPRTGRQWVVSSNEMSTAGGGDAVFCITGSIAVGTNGHLLVAGGGSGDCDYEDAAIIDIDPATGIGRVITDDAISAAAGGSTNLAGGTGIEQAADGLILVADPVNAPYQESMYGGKIVSVDPDTGRQSVLSSLGGLSVLGRTALTDGMLLAIEDDSRNDIGVIGLDLGSDAQVTILPQLRDEFHFIFPSDIGVEPGGSLVLAGGGRTDQVLRVAAVSSGHAASVSAGGLLYQPTALGVFGEPRGASSIPAEPAEPGPPTSSQLPGAEQGVAPTGSPAARCKKKKHRPKARRRGASKCRHAPTKKR
jgi:FG-GAP-like repeat